LLAKLCVETGMNENVHGVRADSDAPTVHHGTPYGARQLSGHRSHRSGLSRQIQRNQQFIG
jgi:hypothetical protein